MVRKEPPELSPIHLHEMLGRETIDICVERSFLTPSGRIIDVNLETAVIAATTTTPRRRPRRLNDFSAFLLTLPPRVYPG